ncbi:Zn-dependent hydrolase [Robbsia andropogonis]|nr:Zn-dependent hydrolase [Robbsia andropogonis]
MLYTPELLIPSDDDFAEFSRFFAETSTIGATQGGGLHRLAASPEDGRVRDMFCAWLNAQDFIVHVDQVGNIFGLVTFDQNAPYVLCGSHLDSQPNAGRFDGVYGVIAGACAIASIARHVKQSGTIPRRNLCVVNWTNEEGARFQPSLTGSSAFTGAMSIEQALACTDENHISLGTALKSIGYRGSSAPDIRVAAYVEMHVEQGTALEKGKCSIGVVRKTWAALKWRVRFDGEQNHTGPTPMASRKDALLAAAHAIVAVRAEADKHGLAMHSSVGRLQIYPNSPNVVPSRATLLVEFRSESTALLADVATRFQKTIETIARTTGTLVSIEDKSLRDPVQLHRALSDLAYTVSERLDLAVENSVTVAGHDAISMNRLYPTCLLFVPSKNGLSHNEGECTSEQDMHNGLRMLTALLHQICEHPAESL